MTKEVYRGQCRCGEVRFVARGRPLITMACHCKGCQRMTAGAFSLSSLYSIDQFTVEAGAPTMGGLKQATRHFFCPSCLSWMFTHPEGMPTMVNIRSPLFDEAKEHLPFIEVFCDEALPNMKSGAAKSFAKVPEPKAFDPLITEYAVLQGAANA